VEFSFIFKIASGVVGSLLGPMLFGGNVQAPQQKVPELSKARPVVRKCMSQNEFKAPHFVTHVPPGHFAGISAPLDSLKASRQSAVDDVVKQVLGAIGMWYNHRLIDTISGTPRIPRRKINDRLHVVANGFVRGVYKRIVESSWTRNASGRYVYFVLVKYPDTLIAEMRRLSKGARLVASVVSSGRTAIRIRVYEVNGVAVTLSSANVKVTKRYRFSKAISMFVWHVPAGSEESFTIPLKPLKICQKPAEIQLPIGSSKQITEYVLGADVSWTAALHGHDEIGRPVTASVTF